MIRFFLVLIVREIYSFHTKRRSADTIIRNLPEMRRVVLETLNMVFMPKEIASQVLLAITLQTTMVRMILTLLRVLFLVQFVQIS